MVSHHTKAAEHDRQALDWLARLVAVFFTLLGAQAERLRLGHERGRCADVMPVDL